MLEDMKYIDKGARDGGGEREFMSSKVQVKSIPTFTYLVLIFKVGCLA